jgi:RNA polymerase sigma-70 factor (ECF subfamily)
VTFASHARTESDVASGTPEAGSAAFARLVERARAGDGDAFGAIYRLRVRDVIRYVASIVRDRDRVEDVVSQTFVLAWRDIPRLRQADRFDAWLFRIAHNQAMSDLRRRPVAPLEAAAEPADDSRGASPVALVEAGADADAVRDALARLPEIQRSVLVMRFLLELPHADVARELGKTEEAVRALQYRALVRMRQLMDGYQR